MHPRSTRLPAPGVCSVRVLSPAVAEVQRELAPTAIYREVAELFGALADPTRITVVHALAHRELCTCELAAIVGISESGVSQHLRILRGLRIVKARRAGKFVYYTLDDAHVVAVLQMGLAHQGHGEHGVEAASA